MRVSLRQATLFVTVMFLLTAVGTTYADEPGPAYADVFTPEQLRTFAFQALSTAYPDTAFKLEKGNLIFPDGTTVLFDDGKSRSRQELLDGPTVFDMFFYRYPGPEFLTPAPAGTGVDAALILPQGVPFPQDAGRIRNEDFFKAMYGGTEKDARKHLARVKWVPAVKGQTLWFTKANGADKALQAVVDELNAIPALRPYLVQPGGTFNWRFIAGTKRLSVHSFGAAVDINVGRSDYWRNHVKGETDAVMWRNRIPRKIVEVFERHGFIWGGWWYHFDTMHFEYRPELIAYRNIVERAIGETGASH